MHSIVLQLRYVTFLHLKSVRLTTGSARQYKYIQTFTFGRHADGGLVAGSLAQTIHSCCSAVSTGTCTHLDAAATSVIGRTFAPVRVLAPRCLHLHTYTPSIDASKENDILHVVRTYIRISLIDHQLNSDVGLEEGEY